MADETAQPANQQADVSAVLSQHHHQVLESTMAEALQTLAIQTAVMAVHKAKQLKDIAGDFNASSTMNSGCLRATVHHTACKGVLQCLYAMCKAGTSSWLQQPAFEA